MIQKRCLSGGCRVLVPYDRQYCDKHMNIQAKQYNKYKRQGDARTANGKTEKDIEKFYNSSLWKKTRKLILIRDAYICQSCLRKGILHEANMVHHKIEIRSPGGWKHRLNMENLEAINRVCHNQIEHKY